MVLPKQPVYGARMMRLMFLSIAVVVSLLPASADAAAAQKKSVSHWHGYGFLPGYHQPPSNSQPLSMQKGALQREARRNRRPWYIDPTPEYFGYDGDWHYFGWPGFYRGHYNGGTIGPCWTRTPIGPIWNCG
jgi:hypothetical protein